MLARLTRRLSYANVVATLALFIALGGSSYAALTVTGKNVKNGSLTGKDIKDSSISSKDVKNRSLLTDDFKPGELPGPPEAFHVVGGGKLAVGSTATALGSLDVPAGAYAVVARVPLLNGNSATGVLVGCRLDVGDGSNIAEQKVRSAVAVGDIATLTLTTTGTLDASGAITLKCNAANGGETFDVAATSLTAIRVATVTGG